MYQQKQRKVQNFLCSNKSVNQKKEGKEGKVVKLFKLNLTKQNLLIAQDLWQFQYQILLII